MDELPKQLIKETRQIIVATPGIQSDMTMNMSEAERAISS